MKNIHPIVTIIFIIISISLFAQYKNVKSQLEEQTSINELREELAHAKEKLRDIDICINDSDGGYFSFSLCGISKLGVEMNIDPIISVEKNPNRVTVAGKAGEDISTLSFNGEVIEIAETGEFFAEYWLNLKTGENRYDIEATGVDAEPLIEQVLIRKASSIDTFEREIYEKVSDILWLEIEEDIDYDTVCDDMVSDDYEYYCGY